MLLNKLVNLMELHEEYLKIHSQLTIDGKYVEAESVQEKADAIWNEIKNMVAE